MPTQATTTTDRPEATGDAPISKGLDRAALPLFLVLFVLSMGFGLIIPIMPLYVRELGATPFMLGVLTTIHALAQAIFSPIWGKRSDRVGRKPMILLGLTGLTIGFVAMGLASTYAMLLIARALGAIISSAAIPTARALVADLSGPERRSQAMGFMGAAMGSGFAMGPILGGILVPFGLAVPFFVGAGLGLVTLVLTTLFVRDAEGDSRGEKSEHVGSSLVGNLRLALRSRSAPYYWLSFAQMFGHTTLFTVLVYLLVDKFGAVGILTGVAFTMMGLTGAAIQGLLIGKITHVLGDVRTIVAGLCFGIAGHSLIAIVPWMGGVFTAVVIAAVAGALIQPMTFSLLSTTSPLPQGVTMGLQGTFRQLGMMLGPLWAGWSYSLHPALPFLSSAALFAVLVLYVLAHTQAGSGSSRAISSSR